MRQARGSLARWPGRGNAGVPGTPALRVPGQGFFGGFGFWVLA
jgi:hypothetical protein